MTTSNTRPTSRSRRPNRIGVGVAAVALASIGGLGLSTVASTSASAAPAHPTPATSAAHQHVGLDARTATYYVTQDVRAGKVRRGYSGQQSDDQLFSTYKINFGQGKVQIGVNVQSTFFTPEEAADFYTGYCERGTYLTCEVKPDTDGSYLVRATKRLPRGGKAVLVDNFRPNATRVVVLTGNTANSKYGGAVHGKGINTKTATSISYDPRLEIDQRIPAVDIANAKHTIRPWKLLPG